MEFLYDKLETYSQSDYYPFHMPGHKRQPIFDKSYSIDITEIDGFDDLHHAEGILLDAMERAAKCYKADESFFLVNGSTCGILSAISAVTNLGDTIMVARNCHKSVSHVMVLRNLKGVYVYPEITDVMNICGQVNPKEVEQILSTSKNIKAFVMVSPTYEGVVSDIEKIAKIVHKYEIPLIVDEAHGAHFCFHEGFPTSAIELGADIVIQSLHKTLPCMTQTAILHWKAQTWNQNPQEMLRALKKYLGIYETSSPSYVLMASMDKGITWMLNEKNKKGGKVNQYVDNLLQFRERCGLLKYIHLFEQEDYIQSTLSERNQIWYDKSKLVFGTRLRQFSGKWLYDRLLEDYHIQLEMCTPDYCIAMTSVMDTEEGFERLYHALLELDQYIETYLCTQENKLSLIYSPAPKAQAVMTAYEVTLHHTQPCKLKEAIGKISAEPVYLYPPGIPIVLPGELLTEKMVELMIHYRKEGFSLRGMEEETGEYIGVVEER